MDPREQFMRRQQEHIDTIGWSVTYVASDPDQLTAQFAYTVGLTARDRPEFVIAGLDPAIAHALLNDLAGRVVHDAAQFHHGQHLTDVLAGSDAVIVEGPATDSLHPGTAHARYGADQVRLQQLVWPDPHGAFPWDLHYGYQPWTQPVLAHP